MKNNKLKKVLKPLIKECIKEIIFEEGVLSSIIREAQGSPAKQIVKEEKPFTKFVKEPKKENKHLTENRAAMRKAVSEKLGNFDPFEGTTALSEAQASGKPSADPMSNVAPEDPGMDISNIPGFGKWGTITERLK
tara:strand:+ start:3450 stop:3854 length:405 start_codon:yes stop_codon:yes gene_type:complete